MPPFAPRLYRTGLANSAEAIVIGAPHRYWRFNFDLLHDSAVADTAGITLTMNKLEAREQPNSSNLLTSATLTSDSSPLTLGNLTDNNPATVWSVTSAYNFTTQSPFRIVADFGGAPKYIGSFSLTSGGSRPGVISLQYSDNGTVWTEHFMGVMDFSPTGSDYTFTQPKPLTTMKKGIFVGSQNYSQLANGQNVNNYHGMGGLFMLNSSNVNIGGGSATITNTSSDMPFSGYGGSFLLNPDPQSDGSGQYVSANNVSGSYVRWTYDTAIALPAKVSYRAFRFSGDPQYGFDYADIKGLVGVSSDVSDTNTYWTMARHNLARFTSRIDVNVNTFQTYTDPPPVQTTVTLVNPPSGGYEPQVTGGFGKVETAKNAKISVLGYGNTPGMAVYDFSGATAFRRPINYTFGVSPNTEGRSNGVAISPDGATIVYIAYSSAQPARVFHWDGSAYQYTGQLIATGSGYQTGGAFSPDGTRLILGTWSTVQVYNVSGSSITLGNSYTTVGSHSFSSPENVAWSPDSSMVCVAERGWLYFYTVSGTTLTETFSHSGSHWGAGWSADGTHFFDCISYVGNGFKIWKRTGNTMTQVGSDLNPSNQTSCKPQTFYLNGNEYIFWQSTTAGSTAGFKTYQRSGDTYSAVAASTLGFVIPSDTANAEQVMGGSGYSDGSSLIVSVVQGAPYIRAWKVT